MPPVEQNAAAQDEAGQEIEQPAAPEESAATGQEAQSPEEQDEAQRAGDVAEGTGEEEAATGTADEGTAEPGESQPSDARTEQKSRTAKRFNKLLDERGKLERENALLRTQLQTRFGPQPAAGAEGEPKQEDTSAYWAGRYNASTNPQEREQLYANYERAKEREITQNVTQQVMGRLQADRMRDRVVNEYVEINGEFPVFKPGTAEIDTESPIVTRAMALAGANGATIQDHATMLYYLQKARVELLRDGTRKGAQRTEQLKRQQQRLQVKTGLESGSGGKGVTPIKDAKSAELRRLEKLSEAGDVDATRKLMDMSLNR